MSLLDVHSAITRIFAKITQEDVRQPSGKGGLNSGEMLPMGVTKMIEAMLIGPSDVFGDIGSGIGSVLAQVALQTAAERCVGVEIRDDLAARSREFMRQFTQEYPRLSRVSVLTGDIKNVTAEVRDNLRGCTVLYCNNQVFEPEDNLAVQEYIAMSDARLVLLMDQFCRRCHGERCVNIFCRMWESETTIQVSVSWSAYPVELFIYHRRIQRSCTALMSLIESMDDDID
jgi:Histone methylation protein DOT1